MRGISEIMVGTIFVFMWAFGARVEKVKFMKGSVV